MLDNISRVLVTGISGSAGNYFIEYMRKEHPDVRIFGTVRRKHYKPSIGGVSLVEADLLDYSSIQRALWACCPQVIFHFAANSDKGFEVPYAIIQNNTLGTVNLFEAIRFYADERSRPPTIVNVSSSEVYGDVTEEDIPIKESCPFRPMSPYAISKVAQDHLGRMYYKAYGLPIINTRAFSYVNIFHPGIFTSAFARQIALIEKGKQKPILKHGNLDSVRVFMDAKDVMHAYWLAATRCTPGEAYNIGGSFKMSVGEMLNKMLGLSSAKYRIQLQQDPDLMRPADVTLQIPNTSKFVSQTNWSTTFDADKILTELLNHYRAKTNG